MADKVQKIRGWISKEQDGLMDAQGNFKYPEHEGAYHILCNLDAYIDSLQEEPVSIDFEQELYKAFGQVKDFTLGMRIAKRFYDMGKNSQEPVSEGLEEAAENYAATDELLPNGKVMINFQAEKAFRAGAKWQKEQMMKDAIDGGCFSWKNGYVHISCDIDEHLTNIRMCDKVKVIVIKKD